AQRLGLVAVGDPGDAGDDDAFGAAGEVQCKAPLAAFVFKRAVARDRLGIRGKAFDADGATHTMRAGDDADADAFRDAAVLHCAPLSRGPARRPPRLPWRAPAPWPWAPI